MSWSVHNPTNLLQETLRNDRVSNPAVGHCHISFRAGQLNRKDGKLKADPRKGQVAFVESDDGLISVQWFERVAVDGDPNQFKLGDSPEVEQLVFESEAKMEWVNQDRRIMKLSFPDEPDRNVFFWLQEPEQSTDGALFQRCNDTLAHLPVPERAAQPSAAQIPIQASAAAQQPEQSAAAPDLSWLFEALNQQSISLDQVLTPALLQKLIAQPGVPNRLIPFLPEEMQTPEELSNMTRAPQFWQQVRALNSAVQRGSIDSMQFGFAPAGVGVKGFLDGLQRHVDNNRTEQKGMWKLLAPDKTVSGAKRNAPDDPGPGPDAMDEG